MNPLLAAKSLGQRLWLDNLSRTLLRDGSLQQLISQDGIAGLTSNPSIFEKAIAGSPLYRDDVHALQATDLMAEARYEQLALADIREACDLFLPVHKSGGPLDGWVSLEVSPALASDTEGTLHAARRLWTAVDRPNVMIKVPATPAGLPAITQLIAEGINVNVTLMFSQRHVHDVSAAYSAGIRQRAAAGLDVSQVRSVASLFLSRIDTLVDQRLQQLGTPAARALLGQAAIANSRVAYARQQQRWAQADWQALGAHPQYLLWASTGTKNPAYADTRYVDELIGANTVNTLPDATLAAFRDHGTAQARLSQGLQNAVASLHALADLGIDLDAVGEQLQEDGVRLFADAFGKLLALLD